MKSAFVSAVIATCIALGLAVSPYARSREAQAVRAMELRGLGECKEMYEACRGLPKCCGETQCYWEDGYSLVTDGYCVTCVEQGLRCQRDTQCCGELVCQKQNPFHTDGFCDNRLPNGSECHEDDNCESDHCEKGWFDIYGSCAENDSKKRRNSESNSKKSLF